MKNALKSLTVAAALLTTAAQAEENYTIYDKANYSPIYRTQINWEDITFDDFILVAMQKKDEFDVAAYLGIKLQSKYTLRDLAIINGVVNKAFPYRLDSFNLWHMQSPLETALLKSGDCKALANYKFHLLRRLGYTNVKIIEVAIADGRGHIGGHVVTLLNDLWVFDINSPYFYPYAILRANNGVRKAFDMDGVRYVKLEGGIVDEND